VSGKSKPFGEPQPPDTIACIEWIDASGQEGPINRHELTGVFRILTVGWLIRENHEHVTLCMDYVPGSDEFREVQHILKINVVKRREYKVKR
jgi:hypothetical protein